MSTMWERLLRIDRRWIFLAIGIAVLVPFFLPLGLPVIVTEPDPGPLRRGRRHRARAGSRFSLPSTTLRRRCPSSSRWRLAILRHCFSKDITRRRHDARTRPVTAWPSGPCCRSPTSMEGSTATDYVFLGFQPGISAVILGMGVNIRNVFPEDAYGTPLDRSPPDGGCPELRRHPACSSRSPAGRRRRPGSTTRTSRTASRSGRA